MRSRAVALFGAVAVAAVGGMLSAIPSAATPPTASTTAPPGTAAAPTTSTAAAPGTDALNWKDCPTKSYPTLQCASLKVPLDHRRPAAAQGRQITLALSRVPHTDRAGFQGPLLVNPGGPGGSGRTLAGFVAGALPKEIAAQYDVIGFDPRGVGASEPALDCSPGHFDPVRPDPLAATAALERANVDRARAFATACGEKYGDLLRHLGTVSAAEDIEVIRRALGAERINYFGYSYGTYLGAVYAKLHPDRVRRAVLDSVVDPTGVWYRDNLDQNLAFDARHKAFTAWVARHDSTYGLGTDPAAVEAEWYAMRATLAQHPAGGKVGAGELEDTFIPGGYFNGYWPDLAEAFAAYTHDRDTAPLLDAHKKLGAVDADGDNGYSMYAAVQCRDANWPRSWATWRADTWKTHAKAPFMAWNNAWYNAPCAFWPTTQLDPPDVTNRELPPVLLFQATEDAATPYEGAAVLHRKLRGSSLVVERGGGNHGVTLSGNACLDRHLTTYLATGEVPRGTGQGAPDATCAALPDPEPDPEPEPKSQPRSRTSADGNSNSNSNSGTTLHGLIGRHR
ncbi:alpha/beta hydrolase [Streptomyces boluensis]|uniref:Alpha/beta fold hydrolase n=1 Tax=Streptomyces boluensis TaxID=1775135 RepID=A0A964UUD2_9ACTN|nr:alpha/beta hydrolase [Streptomyces boluensis]NBE55619.1 alpha/beta fold hydrolase [Streptomyces boluensis]